MRKFPNNREMSSNRFHFPAVLLKFLPAVWMVSRHLSPQQEVEQPCESSSSWNAPSAKHETTRQLKSENRAEPRSDLSCASIASTVANTLSTERPDNDFARCEFRVAG